MLGVFQERNKELESTALFQVGKVMTAFWWPLESVATWEKWEIPILFIWNHNLFYTEKILNITFKVC